MTIIGFYEISDRSRFLFLSWSASSEITVLGSQDPDSYCARSHFETSGKLLLNKPDKTCWVLPAAAGDFNKFDQEIWLQVKNG